MHAVKRSTIRGDTHRQKLEVTGVLTPNDTRGRCVPLNPPGEGQLKALTLGVRPFGPLNRAFSTGATPAGGARPIESIGHV